MLNSNIIKVVSCFILSSILISCDDEKSKKEEAELAGHLSTNLVENPRTLNTDSAAMNELGRLQFVDTLHNFGPMKEGEIVEYEFEFENKGKKDIIITDAKASCGCTVPTFTDKPVKSGEKGKIKITFNSEGKVGYNEKLTFLTTNGNPSNYNLYIQAEVNAK